MCNNRVNLHELLEYHADVEGNITEDSAALRTQLTYSNGITIGTVDILENYTAIVGVVHISFQHIGKSTVITDAEKNICRTRNIVFGADSYEQTSIEQTRCIVDVFFFDQYRIGRSFPVPIFPILFGADVNSCLKSELAEVG